MTKTVLITGASRGIGAATAHLLAAKGHMVVVNYNKTKGDAEKVAQTIIGKGGNAIALQADMGDEASILAMFKAIDSKYGPLAALVNNAAVNPSGKVDEIAQSEIEILFRVNVQGVFIACREAVIRMKKSGGGAIVNISSEAARFGGNAMSHYAASKAAVNTYSIGLAREVAAHKIRVNVVSPGIIDTDAHKTASPEALAARKASIPMGRMGKPEEVAAAVAWLLSEESSYVSGSVLSVSGAR